MSVSSSENVPCQCKHVNYAFPLDGSLSFSIDATEEPQSGQMLGRLVNHGEKKDINVKVVITDYQGSPALCLFALRDIEEGEELLYHYGIRNLPWKVCIQ